MLLMQAAQCRQLCGLPPAIFPRRGPCTAPLCDCTACTQLSNSNLSVAGGAAQTVFVDCANQLLLAAMLDRVIRVYDLSSNQPLMKYEGHTDAVSSIGYLPDKGLMSAGLGTARCACGSSQESSSSAEPGSTSISGGSGMLWEQGCIFSSLGRQ